MDSYDVIVIGTGTAAQVVSSRVRRAGRSVAIIDHRPFGGTCALRGCDPKKMLVSGAEAADWARRMHGRGVAGELRINWQELIAFRRTFTDFVPKKREESFAKQGIDRERDPANARQAIEPVPSGPIGKFGWKAEAPAVTEIGPGADFGKP
jgi:glutathione reductase (NADPH)